MGYRRIALGIPVVLALGLSACTAYPEPDLQAARQQAGQYTEIVTSEESSLGSGAWQSTQQDPPLEGPRVRLNYAAAARAEGLRLACFGEGIARFAYTVRSGSSWTGGEVDGVSCDGIERVVPFAEPFEDVTAVTLDGALTEGSGAVLVAVVLGDVG